MSDTRKVISKGNLSVILDRKQVFPDDPGQGTPAIVECGMYHATYWCAIGEGELFSDREGTKKLTQRQRDWLDSLSQEIDEFLYGEPL